MTAAHQRQPLGEKGNRAAGLAWESSRQLVRFFIRVVLFITVRTLFNVFNRR